MTQNTEFSHSEQRLVRIKMAQAVLNMNALREEMQTYNLPSLQKSASAGRGQEQRIKYAALRLQYEIEKQAVLGAVAKLGLKGLKGASKGIGKALRFGAGISPFSLLESTSDIPKYAPATGTRRARKSFVNPNKSAPAGAGAALGGAAAGMMPPQVRKALSGSAPAPGAGAALGGVHGMGALAPIRKALSGSAPAAGAGAGQGLSRLSQLSGVTE